MNKNVLFAIVIFIQACSASPEAWLINRVYDNEVKVYADFQKRKNTLHIKILSNENVAIIWDWKAFSDKCYYPETDSIRQLMKEGKQTLENLQPGLKLNQVIIEDEANRRRFFSEGAIIEGEWEMPLTNCTLDWFETVELKKDSIKH